MEFLRKLARQSAEGFKDIAEEVWDEIGDTKGIPQGLKDAGRSAGKYALAAQLLMMINFPDEAETFRHSFNINGDGPTGATEFEGTPYGRLLDGVAEAVQDMNASAIGVQGFADVTQTSSYEDLGKMLPMLRDMGEK
ncbi:hypothetical protein CHOED_014 [Vibrio phage CHOED]|uniref:hypothetical protein n=1 Tax=Vibrio phage CHOED TaxID=1458716 RepID=UPI00042EF335|nr:hypothetical protein CHOED_014 [Vibrio phage CHOED]AHK11874.1 hypothetical protein CHOED_014 [Vibrio phage CHOED]